MKKLWKTVLPIPGAVKDEVAKTDPAAEANASGEDPSDEASDEADAKEAKRLIAAQIKTDRQTLDALAKLAIDPTVLHKVLVAMLLSGRSQAVQDFLLEMAPERGGSYV